MNAAVITNFSRPPVFGYFDDPRPSENEMLIDVLAAGLHPVVKSIASGSHYSSKSQLPAVAGVDGVGRTGDGNLVYFGGLRAPYGTMAEKAAMLRDWHIPLPLAMDPVLAAGIFNPAMSSLLALKYRGKFVKGETVLIMGATGASGKLAVQIAKIMGAAKVIAAGRSKVILDSLKALGADEIICLDDSDENLHQVFAEIFAKNNINVVIDYLWGHPTEILINAITGRDLSIGKETVRLVEVGAMAGSHISLPAAALRSSGLEIYGSGGGSVSPQLIKASFPEIIAMVMDGKLSLDIMTMHLKDVESAWGRDDIKGARLVIII